jgi:hypothetical protein
MLPFCTLFLSVLTADPVDTVYKERTGRTLLGPIQTTAVYWSGVKAKICTCFGLDNNIIIVGVP